MSRSLDSIPRTMGIAHNGTGAPILVYVQSVNGGGVLSVDQSYSDATFAIVEYAGGPTILSRSVSGGNASFTTVDGLPVLRCDAPSSAEFESLLPGRYVASARFSDGSSWFETEPFAVEVRPSIGGAS